MAAPPTTRWTKTGTAAPGPNPVPSGPPRNPLLDIAFRAALVLLFVRFSYIHETIFALTGVSSGIVSVMMLLMIPTLLMSGSIFRTLDSKIGWLWIAFAGWMIVCIPFSFWVGGSVTTVLSYLRYEVPILFAVGGLASNWRQIRQMFAAIAIGAGVNAFSGIMLSGNENRLAMEFSGSIANANDFAAHLIFVGPFLLFYIIAAGASKITRVAAGALLALSVYQILSSGSRGAFLALMIAVVYYLARASMVQRLVGAALCTIGAVVLLSTLDSKVVDRLGTLTAEPADVTNEAMESRRSREYLLRQSIAYTIRSPLFGVGPGQFSSYEGNDQNEQGKRGMWYATHNSYTEVSSECGLPALALYLAALIATFVVLNRTGQQAKRQGNQELYSATLCLMLSMVGYGTAIFFLSLAYRFPLLAMSGIAISIVRVVKNETEWRMARKENAKSDPLPAALPARPGAFVPSAVPAPAVPVVAASPTPADRPPPVRRLNPRVR